MGTREGPEGGAGRWFAARTTTEVILAAVIVALVAAVVVVFTVRGNGGGGGVQQPPPVASPRPLTTPPAGGVPSTPATPATRSTSTTPAAVAGSTYNSACGLSGGSTLVPTRAPADVAWQNVGGWYFPVSTSAGPGKRDPQGVWSCFAQTPTGAAIAAYTIALRVGVAAEFAKVVAAQTVAGVGQTALLAQGQAASTSGPAIPKGFLVDSYTSDEATVTYYLSYPQFQGGTELTCAAHVQWFGGAGGDWRLRLETDGSTFSGCIKGAPSRFIAWSPAGGPAS